jgi:transcriptional regulator with XRE-family HTH domain
MITLSRKDIHVTKTNLGFRQWLEIKFLEWQRNQGGRKTVLQFADFLGVSQQAVSSWMNGTRLPQGEYLRKLADKLGLEVYDVLGLERPDPLLYYLTKHWDEFPENVQNAILDQAEKYANEDRPKRPFSRRKKGTT